MTTTDASAESVPEASAELVSPTDVGGRGLTDRQARILLRLLRVAYPHPSFPDAPYERTAKTIEDAGRTDDVLVDGLDDLDARADGDFVGLDEDRATAVLKEVADDPVLRPGALHHRGRALRRPRGLGPARLRGPLVRQGRLPAPRVRRPGLAARPADHRVRRRAADRARRRGVRHDRDDERAAHRDVRQPDRRERAGRGRHRLRRRRRHRRPRAGHPGVPCRAARGRAVPRSGRLGQRRVGGVQPDGLVGHPDHQRLLAGVAKLPESAGVDRQGRRRHDHPLGRGDAAVHAPRVRHQDAPTAGSTGPTCSTGR